MRHVADDGLPAFVHRDVFDPDRLLAAAPVALERLDLRREGPRKLVEDALRTVLLRDIFGMGEPPRKGHGRDMNGRHLCREHGLHLVTIPRSAGR